MKKISNVTIERYEYGDYIIEVEEVADPRPGITTPEWDFWLYRKGYGVKMFMHGVMADQMQANEPHIYTKAEALDMVEASLDEYTEMYQEEYETE